MSPSRSRRRLAKEDIDRILGYCDLTTLRAASLVCRSWAPPSQKHIFSRFQVTLSESNATCFASSSIKHFVCKISIQLVEEAHRPLDDKWFRDIGLPSMATHASRVQELEACFMRTDSSRESSFPNTRDSMTGCFTNVRKLDLEYEGWYSLTDVLDFACSFGDLEDLSVYVDFEFIDVYDFELHEHVAESEDGLLPKLRRLEVTFPSGSDREIQEGQPEFMEWLSLQKFRLVELSLHCMYDFDALSKLGRYIAKQTTLERLELPSLELSADCDLPGLDLWSLTSLKYLSLSPCVAPSANKWGEEEEEEETGVSSPAQFIYDSLVRLQNKASCEVHLGFGGHFDPRDEAWWQLDDLIVSRKLVHVRILGSFRLYNRKTFATLLPKSLSARRIKLPAKSS